MHKIFNPIKKLKQNKFIKSRTIQAVLLSFFLIAVYEILKPYVISIIYKEDSKRIEYEILSHQNLKKSELINIIGKNVPNLQIDYSLDDNLISSYNLSLVELRNIGSKIENDLIIDVNFKNDTVKVLDILGKLTFPSEKDLNVRVSKSPLRFKTPILTPNMDSVKFKINVAKELFGYNVYRSYSKYCGFGKRNPVALPYTEFLESAKLDQRIFYRVANIDYTGFEIELSKPIPWPEFKFNFYSFLNTKNIKIGIIKNSSDIDSLISIFKNAKEELKPNQKLFFDVNKNDFVRWVGTDIDNIPIFFKDEVSSLYGIFTIQIPSLLKNAKILLYIISKSYIENYVHNLILEKREIIDLELIKKESSGIISTNNSRKHKNSKKLLAPFQTRIYNGDNRIILAWSKPESEKYRFVRIFKTKFNNTKTSYEIGEEIYHGIGNKGLIIGREKKAIISKSNKKEKFDKLKPPPYSKFLITEHTLKAFNSTKIPKTILKKLEKLKNNSFIDKNKFLEALRKEIGKDNVQNYGDIILSYSDQNNRPSPIKGIGIGMAIRKQPLNMYIDTLMPYIEDLDVKEDETYIYTLFAYDNNDNYSIPIRSIIKYENESKYPIIKSYPNFYNNIDLLKTLKWYYEINDYKLNSSLINSKIDSLSLLENKIIK